LVVDKPGGMTSHDVVALARRRFGQKRVGHAGTLDPDATGVLLVGLGRVTRLLRYLTALGKSYRGELVLGVETSTLDAGGEVVATHDMAGVGLADVRAAAAGFVGRIEQVPPMVSAVKVGGRRLHAIARAGGEVERPARPVTVHRLDVTATADPAVFVLDLDCSSGTYVRTLAADLGRALGGGAHLANLRRTAVGSFTEAEAAPLASAEVLPAAAALRDYPAVAVGGDDARLVGFGRPLPGLPAGTVAVHDGDGELLAVYEDGRPSVVVAAAD
jgi:tRNA pseudouridine55 synthase